LTETQVETITVATRIPKSMVRRMEAKLAQSHLNKADYIRDLIRRDLGGRGIEIEESQK
jgi:hypothetical protein